MKAVVWTDTFQMLVVIGGLVTMLVVGLDKTGGFKDVWNRAEDGGRINFNS